MIVTTSDVLHTLADISVEMFGEENAEVQRLEKLLTTEELAFDQLTDKVQIREQKQKIKELKKTLREAESKAFDIDPDTWKGTQSSRYDAWNKNNFIVDTRKTIQVTLDLSKADLKRVGMELKSRLDTKGLGYDDYRIRGDYIQISKSGKLPDDVDGE